MKRLPSGDDARLAAYHPQQHVEELSFAHLWRVLVRRRWLIGAVTAGCMLLAALVTWFQHPLFEGEATILISEEDEQLGLGQLLRSGLQLTGLPGARSGIQTDMALLESRQIAEAVVDSLSLQVELVEPQRPRSEVLRVLRAPRLPRALAFQLTRQGDGAYSVEQTGGPPSASLPRRVEVGSPFELADASLALSPGLARNPPDRIRLELLPARDAVARLREKLTIDQPDPGAKIVAVQYRSSDSLLAAAVPNVATLSFLDYKDRTATAESRNKIRFLHAQIAQYGDELRGAERRLQSFREAEQIVEPKSQAAEEIRRLAELQTEKESLLTERESLRRLLSRIEAQPAPAGDPSPYRQLVAFPSFLSNSAVQSVLQLLNELENERANRLILRTEKSIDVQGIDQRIRELELQLHQLARNYLDGLDTQLTAVNSALGRFDEQLAKVPAKEVRFASLTREQELLEGVYNLLQTSLKEEEIRGAEQTPDLRVIDAALVPESPASPRPLINLLLGGVLGLVLGAGIVLIREASDTRVQTPRDAEAATPGLPVIGIVPRLPRHTGGASRGIRMRWPTVLGNGSGADRLLVTSTAPQSAAAEAFRSLRTSLIHAAADPDARIFVITSATPEDGKSTVAANLAVAMAQQGTRTLLVDADLRRGRLHRLFGGRSQPGMTDLLAGRASLEEAVQHSELPAFGAALDFLPAGAPPVNPAELVGSEAMARLLESLRSSYRVVIVDTPPVNLVTDAAVIGTMADVTLLVARAGETDQDALFAAAAKLDQVNARLAGVILNNVDVPNEFDAYYQGANGASVT